MNVHIKRKKFHMAQFAYEALRWIAWTYRPLLLHLNHISLSDTVCPTIHCESSLRLMVSAPHLYSEIWNTRLLLVWTIIQFTKSWTLLIAGDADSSRAPGLTSGLQGSVNVHRGALLLVPQGQWISSFVFYIGLLREVRSIAFVI